MPIIFIFTAMRHLLLLHGAIGAADHFEPLIKELEKDFTIHSFSFPGHGGNEMPGESLSIKLFAETTLGYIDDNKLDKVCIFGYSMGGYVAMYLAKHHPGRVERIVTLATKYHWDGPTAVKEIQMLNADKIEAKLPAFAEALQKRHAPADWRVLLQRTGDMLLTMGEDNPLKPTDYPGIQTPALILLGDRDKMVTLDETLAVYRALPAAQLGILPGTPHPIEQVDTKMLSFFISRFFG